MYESYRDPYEGISNQQLEVLDKNERELPPKDSI